MALNVLGTDLAVCGTDPMTGFYRTGCCDTGTTEWALDSVEADAVVWLPHEGQLRAALGPAFRRLEPVGDGWAVATADGSRHVDVDAERAYARAVLAVLGG